MRAPAATDDSAILSPAAPSAAVAALNAAMGGETDAARRAELIEKHVLECCDAGGPGDPLNGGGEYFEGTWKGAYGLLMAVRPIPWQRPAIRLLVTLRSKLLERQRAGNKLVHTAVLSQFLAEHLRGDRDDAESFRWALHTHAADLLAKHPSDGGLGRVWLYGYFGVTGTQLAPLNQIGKAAADPAVWKDSGGFPEDVIRRLLRDRPLGTELFSHRMLVCEFPLTRPYLAALWDESQEANLDTDEQGRRLETVAEYLFSLLPGCVPMINVVDPAFASQHDVVVANHSTSPQFPAELFGSYFMVECKNWNKPIGSPDVGYFLFRLRQAKCKFGVMFSKHGITGAKKEETNAQALVARSFRGDDVTCVVISEADIKSLIDGERTSVLSLLRTGLEQLRYGTPQ